MFSLFGVYSRMVILREELANFESEILYNYIAIRYIHISQYFRGDLRIWGEASPNVTALNKLCI